MEMGERGPAAREGGEPPHPAGADARLQRAAGGGLAAGPSCALEPRSTPGAWSSGGAGSCLPPHPALCPSAGGGRPLGVLRVGCAAAMTAPGPSKDCEPASPGGRLSVARLHPGGTQQAAVRGRSSSPRICRCRSRRHRPKRTQAEVRRRKPQTPKPTLFPASLSYPKILDEMRHDHRAAVAAAVPGSASAPARRCVNTGPAPTAPPPFTAAAFFPETSPHPSGRMRPLAAAAAGRALRGHRLVRACAPGPVPGFQSPCSLSFSLPSAGAARLSILLGMVENRVPEESLGRPSAPFVARWVLAQGPG